MKLQPHSAFERSGNDLLTKVQITLSEALLGFSRVILTHLDGRGIEVTFPPGKVIRPKETIILRGEGMPQYKNPDLRGDLYVVFDIEFPDADWAKSADHSVRPPFSPAPMACIYLIHYLAQFWPEHSSGIGKIIATEEAGSPTAASCS